MEMMHRTLRIAVSINKITHFTRMDTLIDDFNNFCCIVIRYQYVTLQHLLCHTLTMPSICDM